MNLNLTPVAIAAGIVGTALLVGTTMGQEQAQADRDELRYRLDQATSQPIPTITVRVTAPPKTLPPKTVKVTVRVTERASRDSKRTASTLKSSRGSKAKLDLRWANLWDKIASCESGQRWSLNTGTYDGGLQFLPSTWRAWGGTDFAPYAYQATRAEQITVANRSGKSNPWLQPWPVCGKRAAAALGMSFP